MYKPVRPRPKKTDIVRSRNGCKNCRERRTKCDEKKPTCGTCSRLGRTCESKPEFKFRSVTLPSSKPVRSTIRPRETNSHCLAGLQASDQFNSLILGPNLINSMQRSEKDIFYSTYWEDHCLQALHPIFRSATQLAYDSLILKDAILALSSCNYSRVHGEPRASASVSYMGTFSPNLTHQTRSHFYYSSAIKRFTALSLRDYQHSARIVLMVLILFTYIEQSTGNFQGFYCHDQGLSSLMQLYEATDDSIVKAIIVAWMQSRYVMWWGRVYFSSLDVQIRQSSIPLPCNFLPRLGSPYERRVMVLSILCESHRLNSKATLKHWSCPSVFSEMGPGESDGGDIEIYFSLLAKEKKRLDQWLSHLPPSEQPLECSLTEGELQKDALGGPLRFSSHDAALNYAYYAGARIMQCTGFLRRLKSREPEHLGHECDEELPWLWLLFRIVQGTDKRKCISNNSYTIGFTGLLLAALLRCQNQSLGMEIEGWLQTLEDLQPTEEGAFPVYQTLAVVRSINQRRMAGRHVFGVSQPVDDVGIPKFNAYNSQVINSLLFHGKFECSGALYTEHLSIIR